jgi:hypothetical protein
VDMKPITLGLTAAAAGLVVGIGAASIADLLKPKYGIVLRATNTDIDSQKWTEIVRVLKAPSETPNADSRDKLFRIREFNEGHLVPVPDPVPPDGLPEGMLEKSALLEDYDATILELENGKFTGHAFQIGVGTVERSKRVPKGPDTPQAHNRKNILESKKMVEEVNPFL